MSKRRTWLRRPQSDQQPAIRSAGRPPSSRGRRLSSRRRRLLVERLDERRVLAAITGEVFQDINFSLRREQSESVLESRVLYLDVNQNASLDAGEVVALTDDAGQFTFPSLSDGTYLVRLFNGTSTQQQTFPIEATVQGPGMSVANGNQVIVLGESTAVMTSDSVHVGDTATGQSTEISVANQLVDVVEMPDGTLLAIGSDTGGQGAWLIDPTTQVVRPTGFLSGSKPATDGGAAWSQIELDESGRGFMLGQTGADAVLRSIDTSSSSAGLQVTGSVTVPSETQLLTSSAGPRSVVAWAGDGGLELSLWSNGGSQIGTNTVSLSGAAELLDFDDDSGLLVVRRGDGDISVHSVDDNFVEMHTFSDIGDTISLDGSRELLMALSPVDATLRLIDLRDGSTLANLAADVSAVGTVAAIETGKSRDSLVVLGSAGVVDVSLLKPGGHRVQIANDQTSAPIRFGLNVIGDNAAPAYDTVPSFTIFEDTDLNAPAPAAISLASDTDGDSFILLQTGPSAHGTSVTTIAGALQYDPEQDFNGNDIVPVVLHDGRDASDGVSIQLVVQPVPDPPMVVSPVEPLPEDAEPGDVLGPLVIVDPDGATDGHTIFIDDERFEIIDGQIIFVGGDIDHESEEEVVVVIEIFDDEFSEESTEQIITVMIGDANEPIIEILDVFSDTAVQENIPGSYVSTFDVVDEDENDSHTLTIDDGRFVFRGFDLYLVDDVALDFERTPEVFVNVTATDSGGHTLTQEFRVRVIDEVEQPGSIELGGDSVVEFVPGDVVGLVIVDGVAVGNNYSVSVDDQRFEVVDATLKLVDNQFVELATQSEIQLTITVQDTDDEFEAVSEVFIIDVLANSTPYHNDSLPYDVNRSGHVTAADALAIINYLNTFGPGPVGSGNASYGYDVNSDEYVTALDALLVLNYLNLPDNGGTVGGEGGEGEPGGSGEGEQTPEGESPIAPQGDQRIELIAGNVANDNPVDDNLASNGADVVPLDHPPRGRRLVLNPLMGRTASDDSGSREPTSSDTPDETGSYVQTVDDVLRLLSQRDA